MLSDVNVRRITASSEMPDRPSTLVYNSKIENLSVQVGVPPGVGSKLGVTAEDGRPTRFKPERLGCYVIHVNRTDRGLAKERLRDYWEG